MLNSWNIRVFEYEYLEPFWLLLLLLLPIYLFLAFRKERRGSGQVKFVENVQVQKSIGARWVTWLRSGLILTNATVFTFLILAMAKPFHWSDMDNSQENYKNGIDIILTIDVSMSMLATDFAPNRLEVAKKVAKEFVDGRKGDRIGLVAFAGEAFTACPATLDYPILKQQIDRIGGENIEPGTAIGTGLGTAVTRLRNDSLPSKVIILLTDGSNNVGDIDPLTAAELAKSKKCRVYTIGVGSNGQAPTPVMTPFGVRYENMDVEIDEMTLTKIATLTDGQYFRATDEASLASIYKEIDKLETRRMIDKHYKSEPPANPSGFLNWSILLLVLSGFVERVFFKWNE
ncbi:MAG: VWA domain-containing protein [Bacteroidota bacterium]